MYFLIVIGLVLLFLVECYYRNVVRKYKCNLPGPIPLPFVGSGHLLVGSPHQFYNTVSELLAKYGESLQLYIVGTPYVFTHSIKMIEAVMANNDLITKSDEYEHLKPWLGEGLLTASGEKWHRYRKFLTPAFHFNILQKFLPIFLKNEKILENKLEKIADGREVNIFPIIASVALDNISECAMGVNINAQQEEENVYVKAVNDLSKIVHERMKHPLYKFDIYFNHSSLSVLQKKALDVMHNFTDNVITKRRWLLAEHGIDKNVNEENLGIKMRHAFLDLLILSDIDGKKLSNISIREEVDTFMFEGHDTTTSGVCFALHCIANHPSVQQTLYEEQISVMGDFNREPTNNDLQQMKYLEMVIKESLRLFPSVPLVARKVGEDITINNINIKKGTNMIMSVFHMQRSSAIYEDPLVFKPERFTPEEITKRSPFSWIPFSAGARNCIGQKFAMMEMKVVLSGIIRKFVLGSTAQEPKLCLDLIIKPENGLCMTFQRRTTSI